MKYKQIKNDLMEAMQATKPKTSPYDTEAEVIRVEGSTAWVHIPGGVTETPVSLTIAAQAGDTVRVRVSGGSAWLVGNDTAPPTDDTTAEAAQVTAEAAGATAKKAATAAERAEKIAGKTNQYFWHTETGTDTGAHITEVPQDEFLADPANGGGNLLARSNGIAVRDGLTELATFSASGAQIGLDSGAHSEIDANGQRFYASNGYVQLANIGYGEGAAQSGTAVAPYYTFGTRKMGRTIGNYSFAGGVNAIASGYESFAFGNEVTASGIGAVAFGSTSGTGAHDAPVSNGKATYAEGIATRAENEASHAQNIGTIAARNYQTAIGIFNAEDTSGNTKRITTDSWDGWIVVGDYALIIGNGTSDSVRSNAMDVGWDGEVRLALDTTAATGTTDGDLYAAITAAGWVSEVIV